MTEHFLKSVLDQQILLREGVMCPRTGSGPPVSRPNSDGSKAHSLKDVSLRDDSSTGTSSVSSVTPPPRSDPVPTPGTEAVQYNRWCT